MARDEEPSRRGCTDHRASRLPRRRRAGHPPPPRAARRSRLSGRSPRRGGPARGPDHPCRGRTRRHGDEARLPRCDELRGRARGDPHRERQRLLPALRQGGRTNGGGRHARARAPRDRCCGMNAVAHAEPRLTQQRAPTELSSGARSFLLETIAAAGGAALIASLLVHGNHAVLARMLTLARGHTIESSGLFSFDGVVTDLVLAAIGVTIGLALAIEPAAALVAALPLVVLHRALAVPNLRAQALRDHKTGLLNARGIDERAREELERARRFGRPLSLLMIDIDNLRSINNRYGHLAGDAALVAVAESFNRSMRDYDICARFGGDEFVIVLPETPASQALEIAERVKAAVGSTSLKHDGSDLP